MADVLDRFDVTDDGCWEWTGNRMAHGYGRIWLGSRTDGTRRAEYAHRYFYQEVVGPIPDGLVLDHLCRNRPCVNPDHLEPVTLGENTRRSPVAPAAVNAAKTECVNGHPFNETNTRFYTRGGRTTRACRICGRDAMRRHREKQGHRR